MIRHKCLDLLITTNETQLTDGTYVPQRQALSTILTLAPDPLPPVIKSTNGKIFL
jgi:hypothetical protein